MHGIGKLWIRSDPLLVVNYILRTTLINIFDDVCGMLSKLEALAFLVFGGRLIHQQAGFQSWLWRGGVFFKGNQIIRLTTPSTTIASTTIYCCHTAGSPLENFCPMAFFVVPECQILGRILFLKLSSLVYRKKEII